MHEILQKDKYEKDNKNKANSLCCANLTHNRRLGAHVHAVSYL